jgi:hypothetical protein
VQCSLWYDAPIKLSAGGLVTEESVPPALDYWPTTYWVHHTTSCIAQSNAPDDEQNCCPKHVELIWIYK